MTGLQKMMVLKNLMVHREKNRRTSLMYSLSLGFIIMALVGFNVQIEAIRY
jgi:hypothetical protein